MSFSDQPEVDIKMIYSKQSFIHSFYVDNNIWVTAFLFSNCLNSDAKGFKFILNAIKNRAIP